MSSSYMDLNLSNEVLQSGLEPGKAVIVNVLVNKNILVVQYNYPEDTDPYAVDKLINVRTRYSTDFGQTWQNIELQNNGITFSSLGVEEYNRFGENGCVAEFIIRNSSGTKFLMYSPVYRVRPLVDDYKTILPRRQYVCVGWLVHDMNGTLVTNTVESIKKIIPEKQPDDSSLYYGWMGLDYSRTSSRINGFTDEPQSTGEPFFAYPIPSTADSHYSGSYNAQRVVNRTDSVDYVNDGKRYTIVKRYHNVFVRRGDMVEHPENERVGVGYFVVTLPFIYVFDHTDFNTPNPKLSWVDVLQLTPNLSKLKDYLRPTKYIHSFVKSLISEDKAFHEDVFYSRGYTKLPEGSFTSPVADILSLIFENTPHGELMKVHDQEVGRDLLGLIFGNRRYVCTSNPLVSTNWTLGETKRQHRHPTEKRAFFYRRQMPFASLNPRHLPGRQYAPRLGVYGRHYKKYDTFNLTHQNLRIDIASDRVVAIPDRNASPDGEIRYRFAYFIKDRATGRYSIGLRSEGVDVGVRALTGQQHQGGDPYPLVVNRALGLGFSSESFIASESLNVYSNPLLLPDNAVAPESSVDIILDRNMEDPVFLDDVFDGTDHSTSQYCQGMTRITRATHTPSGMVYDLIASQQPSNACGYNSTAPQPSKAFKLRLQKNLNANIANSRVNYILIDAVFTGDKQIILRPKLSDLTEWDFKIASNTISITFLKPTEFGLTAQTATHTLTIGQDNVIDTTNNYGESTNPSDWRAATCEANSYETLGSNGVYYFNGVRTADNVTLRVENGPLQSTIANLTIGTEVYPFVEEGTVVPYSVLSSATSIVIG